ncbi:MAG: hypothetical protein ACRC6E_02815 [Fusobacteriaceae bacterium]
MTLGEPYFMTNKEWYKRDEETGELVLTEKATKKAKESYKEFYKQLRNNIRYDDFDFEE